MSRLTGGIVGAGVGVVVAAACQGERAAGPGNCTITERPAVSVAVRDGAGGAIAIGTQVRIVAQGGGEVVGRSWEDPVMIHAGNAPGTYDVQVVRPHHETAVFNDVEIDEDACGNAQTRTLVAVLPEVENAPPVRQVLLTPYTYAFDLALRGFELEVHVITAPGVSQAVTWVSRDPSVAAFTPTGMLVSQCRMTNSSTWVLAMSAVDTTVRDSLPVTVKADFHPVRCP